MQELTSLEIEQVSGGMNGAGNILVGLLAAGVGGALTVAGLGTPISIGGAFLAAEGSVMAGIGFAQLGGGGGSATRLRLQMY